MSQKTEEKSQSSDASSPKPEDADGSVGADALPVYDPKSPFYIPLRKTGMHGVLDKKGL